MEAHAVINCRKLLNPSILNIAEGEGGGRREEEGGRREEGGGRRGEGGGKPI